MIGFRSKNVGKAWFGANRLMMIAGITAMALALMPAPIKAETADHAKWVGDVPIMPELSIEQGLGFAFDNPEGRIVTIYLSGDTARDQVMDYYDQALVPLGWIKRDAHIWHRRNESLTINKTPSAIKALWKIMLRPKS